MATLWQWHFPRSNQRLKTPWDLPPHPALLHHVCRGVRGTKPGDVCHWWKSRPRRERKEKTALILIHPFALETSALSTMRLNMSWSLLIDIWGGGGGAQLGHQPPPPLNTGRYCLQHGALLAASQLRPSPGRLQSTASTGFWPPPRRLCLCWCLSANNSKGSERILMKC